MKDNIRSHVGAPRFLISRFANKNKQVAVLDLSHQNKYYASPKNIGVEKGYYDQQSESLLSETDETHFSELLLSLDKERKLNEKTNLLSKSTEIIETFVKFQFLRSKKSLEIINDNSPSVTLFGDYLHSDLLKISTRIPSNPISMIESPHQVLILEATGMNLVSSSLGLYFVPKKNGTSNCAIDYIVIPISKSEAICILHSLGQPYSHIEATEGQIKELNKSCLNFERELGNGFLFANKMDDLDDLLEKKNYRECK